MTKPLILALALAGLSSVAFAQAPTKASDATFVPAVALTSTAPQAAAAPATQAAPAATPTISSLTGGAIATLGTVPSAAPVALPGTSGDQAGMLVNPFNGKPLSTEQLQRELEVARYRSQLLEERLKQTSTEAEIKNVPLRKGVEAAQAMTQAKKEEAQLKEVEKSMTAAAKPAAAEKPATEPKPVQKSKKALAKERAEAEAAARQAAEQAAAQAAAIPPATLLSVISVGSKQSVVLDIRGNVATIADGEMSPAGPVKVLNGQSASVGGRTLKVHDQTIGRFVVSDAKAAAAQSGQAPMGYTPLPGTGSNVTALPPAIPAKLQTTLPPPPLPSNATPVSTVGAATPAK